MTDVVNTIEKDVVKVAEVAKDEVVKAVDEVKNEASKFETVVKTESKTTKGKVILGMILLLATVVVILAIKAC